MRRAKGRALSHREAGRIQLGVKCGERLLIRVNVAFLVMRNGQMSYR